MSLQINFDPFWFRAFFRMFRQTLFDTSVKSKFSLTDFTCVPRQVVRSETLVNARLTDELPL